jgi:pyruvate dehydrogenase E1 component alpha subunit
VTTSATEVVPVSDIADRAKAYNIPGVVVDGQDPIAVYEVVSEAVSRARAGDGPSLIEAKTYRYMEHAEGLHIVANYRTPEEIARWRELDPVTTFRDRLVEQAVLTEEQAEEVAEQVRMEVEEAVEFARQSPFPEPEEAFEGLYTTPISGGH